MKEKILQLRREGKTYPQIEQILGCNRSTISYHCGEGQKAKCVERGRKSRKVLKEKIRRKIDAFTTKKLITFRNPSRKREVIRGEFDYTEMYNLISNTKVCYLTGRDIDLTNSKSYHLDHKIPSSRGGVNDSTNMGVACREANQAKSDMLIEEFIDLCKDVLVHHGYNVRKKNSGVV